MRPHQLNAVYSSGTMKRRYEVWFLRCGLADGTGAWWFRYLIMNLGRNGCGSTPTKMPVQIWATWFPRCDKPQTFIQGFPADNLELSARKKLPFHFQIAENGIDEHSCWGNLRVDGHTIAWRLRYQSDFGVVLSDKGWIGFSKSPHSNAIFSGEICFDGRLFAGDPLGFGVQGHNCGYRHRNYWCWMHAYFVGPDDRASTLEALVYDMPLGFAFRKAVWWHAGKPTLLRSIQETAVVNDPNNLKWEFRAIAPDAAPLEVSVAAHAPAIHHLDYAKTDCSGIFPVANASLARAHVRFGTDGRDTLQTETGAVLEMGG